MMQDGRMVFEEGKLLNERVASGGTLAAKNGKGGAPDEPLVKVGELTLPGNGFRLPVPPRLAEKLAGRVGQHVVLGVRPEHFHTQPPGGEGDSSPIRLQLNVVEPLGNDMDIYMATTLNDHVVGRVEAQQDLQLNTQITVYVDLRKVHFFEPGVTGMNLSLVQESAHAVA
jgi:ABC-type sugar transport system ATPase subunit